MKTRFPTPVLAAVAASLLLLGPGPASSSPAEPSWVHLTAQQKEALAPLASEWDGFDPLRKTKWLEIAVRYKDLSPEGKQKMHERMPELSRLNPQERITARENLRKAYALPPERREEITQQFQELPDETKHALAQKSVGAPNQPPRRPAVVQPGKDGARAGGALPARDAGLGSSPQGSR